MCGCGSTNLPTQDMPESLLSSSGNFERASVMRVTDETSKQQMVMIEYIGANIAAFTVNSRVDHRVSYRFGNSEHHRTKPVLFDDANYLLGLNTAGRPDFQLVTNQAVPDTHDPVAFLSAPITA